jgi:hypothetical protein
MLRSGLIPLRRPVLPHAEPVVVVLEPDGIALGAFVVEDADVVVAPPPFQGGDVLGILLGRQVVEFVVNRGDLPALGSVVGRIGAVVGVDEAGFGPGLWWQFREYLAEVVLHSLLGRRTVIVLSDLDPQSARSSTSGATVARVRIILAGFRSPTRTAR